MRFTLALSRTLIGVTTAWTVVACGGSDSLAPSSPAAPSNVTAVGGDAQITVNWSDVPDATSYNISWSTTQQNGTPTNGTSIIGASKPYVLTGLTPLTRYYFVVAAVSPHGQARSVEVSAAPTGVAAQGLNGAVVVSWSPSPKAATYTLYWSTTPGVTRANGTPIYGAVSPYTHSGLVNGTAYYYMVEYFVGYRSAPSAEVAAEPDEFPDMPTFVRATPGNGQVALTWAPMAGCCTASYYVRWSTQSDMSNAQVVSAVNSPFVHTGLTNGTTYYYQVGATDINGFGPGSPSVIRSATPAP